MNEEAITREVLQWVYGYALERGLDHGARPVEVAAALGFPLADAQAAVEQLLDLGLLRGSPDLNVAASPDEAASRVISPLEREMRARSALIEEKRRRLMSFMPVFEASKAASEKQSPVEVIDDLSDVRAVIAELAAGCQDEILTAQPGGGREEDILEEAAPRDEAALKKGVRMRTLYQHTARFSQGTCVYVERVARLGAQVRTLDDHFTRVLIFDRRSALIEVPDNSDAAALIRDPHVVSFIAETFERLWLAAEPFSTAAGTRVEIADDLKQAIVRLLMEGMTDASIASRLGLSVRTCRRHIADTMAELGAQSRFQAGYMLAARTSRSAPFPPDRRG
ncbi:regulatory LuxR family protein [Streptomyces sp. SLBN-118]|uniref:LuxR C-terminal-related transcriptional regulator n=1 Tax=Streptomyces sp. SLBN-118 TaxID=2768454 RepID=UPI001150B1B2|nr:LuxR C-terminal-related transcriptional regulator [Streptomyces sp. SLBN-118]TQK51148.1 regulatory LuxR family protein [Streptomyces sp. SLBN-118]